MKLQLIAILTLIAALPCHAEFRAWTNAEGQTAELELYKVKEVEGEKVGVFRTRNGKTAHLKSSQLSESDRKVLATWKASVFEDIIDGNLLVLKDDKLVPFAEHECPKKYYVFYYTAYWCSPCRAFTPSLVKWYEQNKNDNFELVLISSDRDQASMEKYAKEKHMPWKLLSLAKAREFKTVHNHGVRGIPSVIVCDLKGKVLGNYRSQLDELTKLVK